MQSAIVRAIAALLFIVFATECEMSSTYTPNPDNNPDAITIPSDGDGPGIKGADVNPAFEGLADKIAWTQAQLLAVQRPGCRLQVAAAASYALAPTGDQIGVPSIGLQPFENDRISLWDGAKWVVRTLEDFATNKLTLAALTSGKNYDVFAYWTGTAVRLELSAAWTNDTTRATALALDSSDANWKGLITKSTDPTRLYVGTFRTTSTTTTESSKTKRFVWSAYHRLHLPMKITESTDTWTYAGASWRAVNGNAANKVEFVLGLGEEMVEAAAQHHAKSTNSGNSLGTAIGLDADAPSADSVWHGIFSGATATETQLMAAQYRGYPGAGYHSLRWLEFASVTATNTFYGTPAGGSTVHLSGLVASCRG